MKEPPLEEARTFITATQIGHYMTGIDTVVGYIEKIHQLQAEIERLREIVRKAHLAAIGENLTLDGYKSALSPGP